MRVRTKFTSVMIVALLAAAGCGGTSAPMSMNPVGPGRSSPPVASVTGTWMGTASDSTGTMMGAGMSASMMSGMTWQITQTGNTFTAVGQFAGNTSHMGGAAMTLTGTINGTTVTFTMTMPGGMMSGTCTAVATGTLDINALMTQMHGTYAGSNSCMGPFDHGTMSLVRQ